MEFYSARRNEAIDGKTLGTTQQAGNPRQRSGLLLSEALWKLPAHLRPLSPSKQAQRLTASIDTGNLHWVGSRVRAASTILTAGKVGDHVRMYAPNPFESGSSVSHWDTALTPDQIMEPSYTGPHHHPVLELPAFQDIGWKLRPVSPALFMYLLD